MKIIVSAQSRYGVDYGWLKSYHLFSFGEYFSANNIHWGALRVFNDDTIAPHRGFDTHSHAEMEIVTIILTGAVTHKDSMGNEKKLKAGMVQRMSAGTGVSHSEYNNEDEELQLYQIWIPPNEKGLTPSYEERDFSTELNENSLNCLVSHKDKSALFIHQDAEIFYGKIQKGKSLEYKTSEERSIFIYIKSGVLDVEGDILNEGDQARLMEVPKIGFTGVEESEFILIDTVS